MGITYAASDQIRSFARYEEDEAKVLELVKELCTYLAEPYEDIISLVFDKAKFRPQWAILLALVMNHAEFRDWGHIEIYEGK